jgi:ADP-heptose:LPS heptosyltransferase
MLKNLSIKTLALLVLISGNIIRKKKHIDSDQIKTILVNRTDRLGDAAISLPFLLELSKRFKVTILTSQYNDPVLRGAMETLVFTEKPLPLLKSMGMLFKQALSLNSAPRKNETPKYDLYLDLVGISALDVFLKVKKQGLCRYYIGFNLGPWNLLLDYAAAENPVLFSKKHILGSYRDLLKDSLGLDINIPDHIDLGGQLVKPDRLDLGTPYILVNISGGDKFRGPRLRSYAKIIEALDFTGRVLVMDEPGEPNLTEFKNYVKKEGLCYLESDYSLWELAYIAKHSTLYIGSDSGITQLLSGVSNCVIFFATGSNTAWRPYSKNPYSGRVSGRTIIEESRNSKGLIKKVAYMPAWCRPCFDLGCGSYRCMEQLDTEFIIEDINRTLNALT